MQAFHVYSDVEGKIVLGDAGVPEVARENDGTAEVDDFFQGRTGRHGQGLLLFMAEALQ